MSEKQPKVANLSRAEMKPAKRGAGRTGGRDMLLAGCLAALVVGVSILDRNSPPEVPIAILYALPLFVAGVLLPGRLATALGCLTLGLYLFDGYVAGNAWSVHRVVGLGTLALAAWWALRTGAAYAKLRSVSTELADKAAQLEAAQSERELVISVVAHELRGALTTVSGYSKLLLRPRSTINQRAALQAIAHAADHLDRLTQDLLDGANLELARFTLTRQTCDLAQLVADNVNLYRTLTDRVIELRTPSEPVFGNWDELRLSQVIRNLLSNSLKYSAPERAVAVEVVPSSRDVTVVVRNAAGELSKDDLERLFWPYSRLAAHERKRGTGLGLYVSKAIIERHGGEIRAWIDEDQACFEFLLPLTVEPTGFATGAPRAP